MPLKPSPLRIDGGSAVLWKDEGLLHLGAEAEVRSGIWLGISAVKKKRLPRTWRHPDLDRTLTRRRLEAECRAMRRLSACDIRIPALLQLDRATHTMVMSRLPGSPLIELLREGVDDASAMLSKVGGMIRQMHRQGVVHGDLSTNNILWSEDEPALVDLGLSRLTTEIEHFGIDLHVLQEILSGSHPEYEDAMLAFESGYLAFDEAAGPTPDSSGGALPSAEQVINRLEDIRSRVRYHG